MTDKPAESAVERYERDKDILYQLDQYAVVNRADAAIAELKARIEELTLKYESAEYAAQHHEQRADEAEAALVSARNGLDHWQDLFNRTYADLTTMKKNWKGDRAKLAAAERERDTLQDEIAKVHHWLLEMFEFFWHDGNSRTHLSIINWLEQPHSKKWLESVAASETREMQKG